MINFELEKFSGPLDLLLQLIEQEELDVSQVSLAKVTDQYLAYLDASADLPANELADFLVVATKLLVIKSKILLPQMADDEEDSAEQLEAQLRMYKEYLEASKNIEALITGTKRTFAKERLPIDFRPKFSPPMNLGVNDLNLIFEEIIKRLDYISSLPEKIMERVVSLKEMVGNIRQKLGDVKKIGFKQLLNEANSKSEVVVCFMALLELIKSGEAVVNQKGIFDEIEIEKTI